jgi:hypothetical protein
MRTLHTHAQTIISVLLPALIAPMLLMPVGADAKPAAKPRAKAGAGKASKASTAAPKRSSAMRLKRHVFPDVSMGMPAAYTVMLPPGWSAQGKVEWQPVGVVPFPKQMFEISSPQKGRISFEPSVTFSYVEGPGMPAQGVPAPADLPQWLSQAVAATNPKVSDVKLVSRRRDAKTEAFVEKLRRDSGTHNGMQTEIWNIVMDYNEASVRRRGEVNVTYTRFEPYVNQNMNSQTWSIAPLLSISAPAKQFAAQRQTLLNVAGTVHPTPQWHIQSQKLIAEMSRQRTANNWEIIKERGRQISELSDADYAKYRKDMSQSDGAQRQRINGINETDDFRDTTGSIVNLPMHYRHVFSDGKGNYVLSNNSQDKPGASWESIKPLK